MKKIWSVLLVLSVWTTAVFAHDIVPGKQQDHPILLRGGDVHTVSGPVQRGADVLFDEGKIVAIGRNLAVPANTEIIDVSGRNVYPGLIAARTVLGLIEIGAVRATDDDNEVGDLNPEVIASTAFNPDSELIPTVRSNGITTAQVIPLGNLLRGRSFIVQLDGWTIEDSTVVPVDALHLAWPSVAISRAWWVSATEEEQREQMKKNRDQLYAIFDDANAAMRAGDDPGASDLLLDAMAPALRGELPVFIEADDYRQIVEALRFAREYGLNLVITGGREADRAADLLRRWNVPVILDATQALPFRRDDPYDQAYALPAKLHEAGVKFAISDPGSWSSRDLPLQAAQAVGYGLPKDVALRSVTLSVAEILGISDRQGSLEPGKDATLIVSDRDILDTLGGGVSHMWIEGRAVDLDDRHKQLRRKYSEKIRRAKGE
ncbi:MAG: amidohydrolase family protein [Acidobacteria bacterium]|nr:amidohydrolase family protein [Acidobacteriota bacterium]